MTFASPYLLLLLVVVPIMALLAFWLERRTSRYAVSFTNIDLLASVVVKQRHLRTMIPLLCLLLALASAATAVARPRAAVRRTSDRAAIVLLVDVSGSMRASDVKPTRLLAAARAMSLFSGRLPKKVRVGLVSFSGGPDALVPPTTDRTLLQEGIDGLVPEDGTAIGDGLRVAVQMVNRAVGNEVRKSKDGKIPGAIILLSDGHQTDGSLTPLQGADLARKAGIRVFTVALGTNHAAFGPGDPLFRFGLLGRAVYPDPLTLAMIARDTEGETFRARSADRVDHIYRQLGERVATETAWREVTSWFAGVAALLLLASICAARATASPLP